MRWSGYWFGEDNVTSRRFTLGKPMSELPRGIVTLLFSDIEGSTRLLQSVGERYGELLREHQRLMRRSFEAHGGREVGTEGDAFFVAFRSAADALNAAVDAQRALQAHPWEGGDAISVRMGLHTGTPNLTVDNYWGLDVHRAARICSAAHGGQILASAEACTEATGGGQTDFDLRDLGWHRLKDLADPEHLFQINVDGLPSSFPPIQSLETPSNLPALASSFVGRVAELEQVQDLLRREDVRFVTLIGPGGTGKSRLAVHAAETVLGDYPDGVFLVNLAPVDDPGLVPATVAQTLGLKERGDEPVLAEIARYLERRHMLLLLDNFEHVLAAAPLVTELLASSPRLKVLATTRSALRLAGEHEYHVPPLGVPDPHADLQTALSSDAVSLFVQRAKAVKPSFDLTTAEVPTVVEICSRLDGLPLALELAAARTKLLTPSALLARLDRHLQLLTGGGADRPERHQTLRATIEWSYTLLDSAEQQLFRRFSTFMGGCTLEAAEAVLAETEDEAVDILEGISSLLDKSLLAQAAGATVEERLRMLRTIRDFAFDELIKSGEADAVRFRHARYFCALAEHAEEELSGEHENDWLLRLDAEYGNMRAALAWLLEGGGADADRARLALRLAGGLGRFWYRRARLIEGSDWLQAALARDPGGSPEERAKALYALGVLLEERSHQERAVELFIESLNIYRALGDEKMIAASLNSLGIAISAKGRLDEGRTFLEESLAIKEKLGDSEGVATTLGNLAILAMENGDLARSEELFLRSMELSRQIGDRWGVALTMSNLAPVKLEQGDPAHARELSEGALAAFMELSDLDGLAECLETFAAIAASNRRSELAGKLAGAAATLRVELDSPKRPVDLEWFGRYLDRARRDLGKERFEAALAEGQTMSPEAASELALRS
jgi:predicted ATPase/class 3 adenylate cyclase